MSILNFTHGETCLTFTSPSSLEERLGGMLPRTGKDNASTGFFFLSAFRKLISKGYLFERRVAASYI